MTIPRTAAGLKTYSASLPTWDEDDDEDPNWIVPMYEFEGIITALDPWGEYAADDVWPTEATVIITPDTPIYSAQDSLRLDALVHYLDDRDTLFDRDAWFGTDHPVVLPYEDGYQVLDGNHRTTADRITGRSTLAYLAEKRNA